MTPDFQGLDRVRFRIGIEGDPPAFDMTVATFDNVNIVPE